MENKSLSKRHSVSGQSLYEEEINLRDLITHLWKGKWWILVITSLFAIASVIYALSLPNEYRAETIVAPASSGSNSGLSGLSGQLGGLANLAGVSLGSSESDETIVAMELMQTWGFADVFIKKHNLQVPLFGSKGWDFGKQVFIYDEDIYDGQKWVREPPKGKTVEPTSWELYEKYKDNLSVSQNKDTGLIKIGFISYSPQYSQKITQWLVDDVNSIMKERALEDASKNIAYLENQISKTALSDMQKVFYSLIEDQTKTQMLAEVSDEYVFKSISPAFVPEEKSKPSRAMICIAGTFLGGFLSLVFLFLRSIVQTNQLNEEKA